MGKNFKDKITGLSLISLAGAQAVIQDPASACSSIASSFSHPKVTINFSEHVAAGTNLTLDQSTPELVTCDRASQVAPVDLCRVAFYVATSNRSGITAEAWLPTNWTGRYLSVGNGGLNGCIAYEDIAYGTESGFAAVGSNDGHNGTAGNAFYQNADVVEDFAYRSIVTETLVGKALTYAFYSKPHTKSYYAGCSTGGRQGFKMAQDHPDLFDGILAGAPALAFNNLSAWSGHFLPITGSNTSATYLSPAKWALVHADILAQCDSLDGAVDGIIEDPSLCTYEPVAIECPSHATNTSTCLTAPQVSTVTQIFSPYYGEAGSLIYPRMQPGSELVASRLYYNGQPFPYTTDWYRYAILQDPNWDSVSLNSSLAAYASSLNPFNIETWSGDLSAFRNKGGKLLHYHGLVDGIISSDNSPRYYSHVAETMSLSPSELDSFYRFFRISGMGHCSGGDGAWQIGQESGGESDAEHNVLRRMVEWVEKGAEAAPESVIGTKYVNDEKKDGIEFERRHCKWPKRNRYVGPGNWTSVDAWECVV
ncbi:Putative tannase/feruloyl esterase, alpha/Beta hydrolase [Septoria linicola]|uniref:Carboxylic ester hydrolase n=1 Tax=Septoria linicola TaxID=215465 RepID=A0A9Q9AU64_9PEZI|nr:putative tannase/feruloyl esterase, alpha/Beta hydrolase [Septoria linicola]USW50786.1 Putative tannase/feruloyl esterase, alpha/Beta hydrolase [Septoria linicola]